MIGIERFDSVESRFLSKVAPPNESGCMLWTAARDGCGYGHFVYEGKKVLAHRYAAGMLDFPPKIQVRHLCHTPPCVNPEHLTFGSAADNMRDMVEAGRSPRSIGEGNGQTKLTESQVLEIRRLYAAGDTTQRKLAAQFGLHQTKIGSIIRRELWKHI
jgi:hypothetical protein